MDTRDKHLAAVAWPVQTSHTPNILKSCQSDVTCFRCGDPNHLARDCMQRSSVRHWKERSSIRYQNCNKTGHICLENGNGGREVSTTLSPFKLKEVLPVIEVVVNGKRPIVLVDSGCSWSLVTETVCKTWSGQASDVLTVDGKILHSNGIGTITLAADNISPVKAVGLRHATRYGYY